MAYQQPGIQVIQNFQAALPTLSTLQLTNVSVGPLFQVLSDQDAGAYMGAMATYDYPNQYEGSYIDTRPYSASDLTSYPVTVVLENAVVQLLTGSAGVISSTNLNQFTDSSANFSNLLQGDVLVITGSTHGNNGSYTVWSVVNATTLQIAETFAAADTALAYDVTRNISEIGSNTAAWAQIPVTPTSITEEDFVLPGGIEVTYAPFGTVPIVSAEAYVSYRALRFDQANAVTNWDGETGIEDLESAYGADQLVPQNPVIFSAYVALLNSPTDTQTLALPETFLNTGEGSGDELLAYSTAFEVLALNIPYAIAVLTQNTSVHTALSAFVTAYSASTEGQECVGICNPALITTQDVTSESFTGVLDSSDLIFTDTAAGEFLTDGVEPGMYVQITSPTGAAGTYEIESVTSQTLLTLVEGPTGGAYTDIEYIIYEDLDMDGQAAALAAYSASIGNRRIVMSWPDIVVFPVGNVATNVPGYFLNSCIIALTSGLPTQQGLTNLSVAGYTGVVHSTLYFTNDQLNVMAGGGMMIFVQDILNQTALYVRHQLTTNMSSIYYQEYSITKNVDFVAKFIRANSAPFIGQYNIVDPTIDELKQSATGMMDYLVNDTVLPQIGGVLTSGSLTSIEQDPEIIDQVDEVWSIGIPIPLNNLQVTLNISGTTS